LKKTPGGCSGERPLHYRLAFIRTPATPILHGGSEIETEGISTLRPGEKPGAETMEPARMKPGKKSRKPRRALTQEERAAEFYRERDRIDRQLARKISAWAKIWERCPEAGCRRNARCRHEDDCRGVSGEMTDEDCRWVGEQLRAFWETIDPAPKYDGDKVR
jgi:hypothetical protein